MQLQALNGTNIQQTYISLHIYDYNMYTELCEYIHM